jgi:hypothetical protein
MTLVLALLADIGAFVAVIYVVDRRTLTDAVSLVRSGRSAEPEEEPLVNLDVDTDVALRPSVPIEETSAPRY